MNRSSCRYLLDADLARTERNRLALAVAALDLDGFKNVNDTHGHDAGDVGIADTRMVGYDGSALLAAADDAMYDVKRTRPTRRSTSASASEIV